MKYTVKIADTSYEVEIEDILARPIVARVDGETFEVHPENGHKTESRKEKQPAEFKVSGLQSPAAGPAGSSNELTAPLPGIVVEIFVKKGEEVDTGHVMLVIEAMKMKNSIRSTRSGKISDILVTVGQTVAHKQALVRFE